MKIACSAQTASLNIYKLFERSIVLKNYNIAMISIAYLHIILSQSSITLSFLAFII